MLLPACVSLVAFPKAAETKITFVFKCVFDTRKPAVKSTQIIRDAESLYAESGQF